MWMEERIGKRVNLDRVDEAIGTETSKIATGCPFCRVMLTDGLTTRESEGAAGNTTEVLDVAQLLLAGVKRGGKQKPAPAEPTKGDTSAEPTESDTSAEPTKSDTSAEPTKSDTAAQETGSEDTESGTAVEQAKQEGSKPE
jgi:hypothetical protein